MTTTDEPAGTAGPGGDSHGRARARAHPGDAAARVASVRDEFAAETTYLDTAAVGLPPRRVVDAVAGALAEWRAGRARPPGYDAAVDASRSAYAGLVGVDPSWVAVGPQVSVLAGLVAASLPDGSEVVTARAEFTSVVFPFLAQAHRGVVVREVPLADVASAVTDRTALVAVAAVQSADGRLVDLDALTAAAAEHDARVLVDLTQATGWLPVDASRVDYTACGGYKWLLAPRGTCLVTVRPERVHEIVPHTAGWYGGEERWDSIYGGPLRLATGARRLDVSPAWLSWVGQAAALELLTEVGPRALHAHALGLADRFRAGVGLPPGDSAIVSLGVGPGAAAALPAADIVTSVRAGRLRLSFHVHNTTEDADLAAEVLRAHVRD